MNKENFLGNINNLETADTILMGIPYDGTSSYRPGSRFAPNIIRDNFLMGYETYSPYLNKDLSESKIYDYGNLEIDYTDPKNVIEKIYQSAKEYFKEEKKVVTIGGEHSISIGLIKAAYEHYNEIVVLQLDAHTDLRKEYLGSKYSHACVMRRVGEIVDFKNVFQFGIRSGLKEEFSFARDNCGLITETFEKFEEILEKIKDKKVYITLDLDILDPAYLSGTGTPEPGGLTIRELFSYIYKLQKLENIIGFDIVELSPHYDQSGASTAVAIKILREMLLLL